MVGGLEHGSVECAAHDHRWIAITRSGGQDYGLLGVERQGRGEDEGSGKQGTLHRVLQLRFTGHLDKSCAEPPAPAMGPDEKAEPHAVIAVPPWVEIQRFEEL